MLKLLISFVLLGPAAFQVNRSTPAAAPVRVEKPAAEKIHWYSWQEAVELNKTAPKKIIVDVYTSWCGWCKVMDRETFQDDKVVDFLNKNFYCVKMDAEGKTPIEFNGQKFEYVKQGNSGVHTLAYSLLDGQLAFPTIVYLNEKFERVMISQGYKTAVQIIPELKYTSEEAYKSKTWEAYQKGK